MNENFIKSALNVLINNKIIFSNMLIITCGGTIGLLLKAINVNTNLFEIILMIIGTILTVVLVYILLNISEKISIYLIQLKEDYQEKTK
jgi:uncharacterized membrane protein